MKKISLFVVAVLSFTLSRAQYTVISDDSSYVPTSANALLEVHSQNGDKGILVPRLTTAQRTAITTVVPNDNSLLVYDTDTKTFWYYDGTAWVEIATGGTVTDDQNLTLSNDTLYIEDGNWIYLGGYNQTLTFDDVTNQLTISNGNTITIPDSVNDADSDPTNEIELPATAVNGQVLTWDAASTSWIAQNPGAGADNWGSQTVVSDATLSGDGTAGSPLTVNGDLTDDQNISGSGLSGNTLTIGIENGSSETVDLTSFMDNTDNQTLSLSGNSLSILNGNTVDLSSFMDNTDNQNLSLTGTTINITNGTGVDISPAITSTAWSLTGNSGTVVGTNFLGTTDNVSLAFKTNNAERLRITNTGFVGIGTSSPSEALDVSGNVRATGIVYWGSAGVRTEDRADAGAWGAGIKSGFYQTSAPSPAADWPTGASGWWHLLDIRHTNTTNNYAMQFAGSFSDQKLYFRKTNNNSATPWNEVTTAATETYTAVSLGSNIAITTTGFADISGMSLTFVAKKSTVLVTVTASGHGYTNSMAFVSLRVWNVTSNSLIGGCSNKIQAYDDMSGTITVWNTSYSKLVTGLTPGNTYTFKVQGARDGVLGTYDAVIEPVTYPDDEHLTLSVFY